MIRRSPRKRQLNPGSALARGLFDYFIFDQGAGILSPNLAYPQAPALASGTYNWTHGPAGNAMHVNAGSMDSAYHGNLVAGQFSVWFMTRATTWPNAFTSVVNKVSAGNSRELLLCLNTTGQLQYFEICGSGAVIGSGPSLATGMVHQIAITRNAAGTVSFYFNGLLAGTLTNSTSTGVAASTLKFGRADGAGGIDANSDYMTGATWLRCLSPSEVLQLQIDPLRMLIQRRRGLVASQSGLLLARRRRMAMAA